MNMSTPNSQLPTPKGTRSRQLGRRRRDQRAAAPFRQLLRTMSLGSWKLGVGSCLGAILSAAALAAQVPQQPPIQRAPGTLNEGVTAVLVDVIVRDRRG